MRKRILLFGVISILLLSNLDAQKLIVRMDDFGGSHSANLAIVKCYQEGIGRSTEIMPVCPWFLEAARLANENPGLDVGVHVSITSEWMEYKWRPLTSCPSLCDADGYLKSKVGREFIMSEAEAEIRAQIELAKKYVKNLTHITDHMMWTFAPGMNDLVERLATEYGLFYQGGSGDSRYGIQSLGMITGNNRETTLLEAIKKMEKGKIYWTIEHPSINNEEMDGVFTRVGEDVGADRQNVTDAFTSSAIMQYIKENGIELIGFDDAYNAAIK